VQGIDEHNRTGAVHAKLALRSFCLHSRSLSLNVQLMFFEPNSLRCQDGYVIFNSTVSASLGMTLNSSSPNTYALDLFNAERHTTGDPRT